MLFEEIVQTGCSLVKPSSQIRVPIRKAHLTSIVISGPKEFFYRGHNYFYSGHVAELAGRKVDWLDARNLCREYCMDLVSMETQEENNLVFKLIQQSELKNCILSIYIT